MRVACGLLLLLTLSCSRETARTEKTPEQIWREHLETREMSGAVPIVLRHHEVDPNKLAKPLETPDTPKACRVIPRPANAQLVVPPGFRIEIVASGFRDPRNMALAPNGDVFLADAMGDRILVLRDENGDGKYERHRFANVKYPFGIAFHDRWVYIGAMKALLRYEYKPGQVKARKPPELLMQLPGSGQHMTRNISFSPDGSKLYLAAGSSSNKGIEKDPLLAAITELDPDGKNPVTFASGMRNPVGLGWHPETGTLWATVNERDRMGDDLPPDYFTEVRRGDFYGWPYAYIGPNPDPDLKGARPDLVAKTVVPSLLLQAHSAPLNFVFYTGTMFPEQYRNGAFIALHGSWNRSSMTGYKVVHVPFKNGKPSGGYDDFVAGWEPNPKVREVWGRPAGLLVLPDGSLLIADDGAGVIWRVSR